MGMAMPPPLKKVAAVFLPPGGADGVFTPICPPGGQKAHKMPGIFLLLLKKAGVGAAHHGHGHAPPLKKGPAVFLPTLGRMGVFTPICPPGVGGQKTN